MDFEIVSILGGVSLLLATLIGGLTISDNYSKENHIHCVQVVHDKPALEINLICPK